MGDLGRVGGLGSGRVFRDKVSDISVFGYDCGVF